MSRTYKHIKKYKLNRYYRFDRWETEYEEIRVTKRGYRFGGELTPILFECNIYMPKPGVKLKKRKELDTEWHWMATPSWWNRMQHTRPARRRYNVMLKTITDLDDIDVPNLKNKPHMYYY